MQIEDLIKKRKDELNVETAPPEVWENIRKDWKPKSKKSFQVWKAAAVLFIAATLALTLQNVILQNKVNKLASLGDISEEYHQIETNYITQVNEISNSLELDQIKDQEDFQWLFEELEAIEEINSLYRSDIGLANEAELVKTLVDYYEKKIRILKKLELEIERTNKLNNNEKTDTDSISI